MFHRQTIPNRHIDWKEWKTFWEVYHIAPEYQDRVIPIIQRICLDCFDLAWQSACSPGFTWATVDEKISELCARALRGGKHAPSFKIARLSLERASLLREYADGEARRKLDSIVDQIYHVQPDHGFWHNHIHDHANRHLSMSGERPGYLYLFRSLYRRKRRAAGLKGWVCHLEATDEPRDPISIATMIFAREKQCVENVETEVKNQIVSLTKWGMFDRYYSAAYKWQASFGAQTLFEMGDRVLGGREDDFICVMLNLNTVPLTTRLAHFKERKKLRSYRQRHEAA